MTDPKTEIVAPPAETPVVPPVQSEILGLDEKKVLMQRAKLMGLNVSPNIGLDTLREKIKQALIANERIQDDDQDEPAVPAAMAAAVVEPVKKEETEAEKRRRVQKDALKLVRVRITCLNPSKKDLPGEIFTVGNRYIGTVRKFVPFGDQTENGYHIPHCLYEHLKSRKFLNIVTRKTKNDGILVQTSDVSEFAIEVLPQLTPKEISSLAQRQAMANGTTQAAGQDE